MVTRQKRNKRSKNAFVKDIFREIFKTQNRFLSIFSIVAIGVGFFAGLTVSGPDMKLTADTYFNDQNLSDFRLVSTLGFTDDDVQALREIDGVQAVAPGHWVDTVLEVEGDSEVVKVMGYDFDSLQAGEKDIMNVPLLLEGRFPQSPSECVVEATEAISGVSFRVGDSITLTSGKADVDLTDTLSGNRFTIVGIVQSPLYISINRGTSTIGSGKVNAFIMVPNEAFLEDCYTEIYLRADGVETLSSYSQEYRRQILSLTPSLEELGEERAQIRLEEVRKEAGEKIADAQKELDDGIVTQQKELSDARQELEDARKELEDGEKELADATQEYYDSIAEAEEQIAQARQELNDGEKEYLSGLQEYEKGEANYEKALADTLPQLEAAEKTLAQKEQELSQGQAQYDQVRALVPSEGTVSSILADPSANPAGTARVVGQLSALAQADASQGWAGDLADYLSNPAGMTQQGNAYHLAVIRQVNSELAQNEADLADGWTQLNTGKQQILQGRQQLDDVGRQLDDAYEQLKAARTPFWLGTAVASTFAAAVTVLVTVLFSCGHAMKEQPALLMRPKAPQAGKRVLLERIGFLWNRLSFSYKVTFRNLFRYKKRMLMTVVGIAGCSALMVTGFGMYDSIRDIVGIQFGELYHYDLTTVLQEDISEQEKDRVEAILFDNEQVSQSMYVRQESMTVKSPSGKSYDIYLFVAKDPDRLDDFITLQTRRGKNPLSLSQEGVILTEKMASFLGVEAGDSITVTDTKHQSYTVVINAITEHYTNNYLYMTPQAYEKSFGQAPSYNMVQSVLAQPSEQVQEEISSRLVSSDSVLAVSDTATVKDQFKDMIHSMTYVMLVLIISAGSLAFVVLYNLSNINITERVREIATIKVLGFHDKEVSAYIFRENIFLTLLGAVIGLGLGVLLHHYVVITAETDIVMFGRTIKWASFVYAAALTMAFSFLVNLVMHFKLKKVSMVESLKSIE